MTAHLSHLLIALAALALAVVALEGISLRRHVRAASGPPGPRPPVSVLKPLCGVDESLEENLASFARLDYPAYEVVLGVRSRRDPAWPVAREAARRWPERFRVVLQRGEPGLNPKVNQLVTLARAARFDLLVVSDSNVRVGAGYLAEIADLLADDGVGLVTHPIAGVGEARLGSLFDHLHLTSTIAPAVVASSRIAGLDFVVGKSMALRRADLERMGGFEAVKDVLAEDYVMGRMVRTVLGKRVAIAARPVQNVSERRTVREFTARYQRWGVLQRQAVGPLAYGVAGALANPVLLAAAGATMHRDPMDVAAFLATCVCKAALDGASARALRPGGFALGQLAWVPVKDLVFAATWVHGLVRHEVVWRGTRLRVLRGTRVEDRPGVPSAAQVASV